MPGLGGAAPGGGLAVFTICSNNYIPFARVLFDSVRRHHPDAELFLCLADRRADLPGLYPDGCTVVEGHTLPVPDFPAFAFRYDIMEFNTALKPFMVRHLLEQDRFDAVLYFDPDIELFAPLAGVVDALGSPAQIRASFVLTPHLCSPSEDRREPNDLSILRAGAYNLGFLGVSGTAETRAEVQAVTEWWGRRLRLQCVNAQDEGLFVDQKFMDLVPGFAPRASICRDTTLNVAYWNLGQRRLGRDGDGWTVDGAPLTFFHFSGFDPGDPARLSRHDPRFVGNLPPPLRELTARYAGQLLAQGHGTLSALPYAYGRFASGSAIPAEARRAFRARDGWEGDPFATWEGSAARGDAPATVEDVSHGRPVARPGGHCE